jgi:hypothetical protein
VRAPGGLLCMCSAGRPLFDGTIYVYVLLIKPIINSYRIHFPDGSEGL